MDANPSDRFIVIMAGGRGERFWPQSRIARPKHLLPIVGDQPMLTQTVERFGNVVPPENVLVITNREQLAAVRECLPTVPTANIVAEPVGRDTAAAVGLAAALVAQRNPRAVFAMLPADHVIHDHPGFQNSLRAAFETATTHPVLCTIGIRPDHPATGYGYIEQGTPLDGGPTGARHVLRFVEKPDLETASSYLQSGSFFWNAGMFFWQVEVIRDAIRTHAPGLSDELAVLEKALAGGESLDAVLERIYPSLTKISIDYAVMQAAENVAMVEATFDWDDVGSWPAVARHHPADAGGNVHRGKVLLENASGNIVLAGSDRAVVAVGVDDLIIVETPDATLVCPKNRAEEIKAAVRRMGSDPDWQSLL